jgi:hypothetical protein
MDTNNNSTQKPPDLPVRHRPTIESVPIYINCINGQIHTEKGQVDPSVFKHVKDDKREVSGLVRRWNRALWQKTESGQSWGRRRSGGTHRDAPAISVSWANADKWPMNNKGRLCLNQQTEESVSVLNRNRQPERQADPGRSECLEHVETRKVCTARKQIRP